MTSSLRSNRESTLAAVAKRVFLYAIYIVFCVSLFLPATEATVTPSGPANVHQTFRRYILDFWMLAVDPTGFFAMGFLFLGSLAVLSFPLADLTFGKSLYLGLGVTIALCALAIFAVPFELLQPLRYGSFLWMGSIVTMAVSLAVLGSLHYLTEQSTP